MKTLTFKIAVKNKMGKEIFLSVSLLELQSLQIKRINFRYVI